MSKSQKGSAFERRICRELSLWWSEGKNDSLFWRTSNSGGRATTRAKKSKETKNAHGDIAATDPSAQPLIDLITFELKKGYNKFTIQDLIDKPKGAAEQKYEQWIRKANISRIASKSKWWALIAQRDRREPLIFLPGAANPEFVLGASEGLMILRTRDFWVCCLTLKEFLQIVDPRDLERSVKKCS